MQITPLLLIFVLVKPDSSLAQQQLLASDVMAAAAVAARGGVIAYPTDTVWGLGCDARNAQAVSRLFELKGRPGGKAMISLVADGQMLVDVTGNPALPALLERLQAEMGHRPVTLVVGGVKGLAPGLTCKADGTTALRVTADEWSASLCRALGGPVVSTSANFAGQPAPRFFAEISPELLALCDYTAAWRRNDAEARRPSAVVRPEADGSFTILRS